MKSWPFVGDTIYKLYILLLPLYPTTAHMHPSVKVKGQKAKYPADLMRDLVDLFKKRFPGDFDDLNEKDVTRAIQYRMKNPRGDHRSISDLFL